MIRAIQFNCRLIITIVTCTVYCASSYAQAGAAYQKEIDDWHAGRITELKADDGWLNLAGLYWLDEGRNSFGSGSQNKIIFPKGSIADNAGYFERTGNTVKIVVAGNAAVNVDGKPVRDAIIFQENPAVMPVVSSGSLRWVLIKREDKIGVRLRDLNSPAPAAFTGVDRFPVDSTWRLTAVLQKPDILQTIAITNIIGQTTKQGSPGKLAFYINNKLYTLDALQEGDHMLIVFGDATSGNTTYPSGRFLEVQMPGADGKTIIDFNKAYNPPCAFTDYATCPLPPSQNVLPVEITAGEKNYGHHEKR